MAGRMGTERGETGGTLYKAPWVRTDHHSGRQVRFETSKSGRREFLSLICEVYDRLRDSLSNAPGGAAGAAGAGGHTARLAVRDGTGIE